ncbi:MAG: AbrB/MazE/SpoVT family DNA-binding domain-containing protein [bacterium]|nr:AbrB/MazE/SpoVT family DNA-binding domain-containing protein [bacterium]
MRKATYVRKSDKLGRIVLPVEIRKTLGMEPYDRADFEIIPQDGGIFIKPYNPNMECACCHKESNAIVELCGMKLCNKCIMDFREELVR